MRDRQRYPGGAFFIDASADGPPPDLALIGLRDFGITYPAGLSLRDQCIAALNRLAEVSSLLIYDGVRSSANIGDFLPEFGTPCHAVLTTIRDPWATGRPELEVTPLNGPDSRRLVHALAGDRLDEASVTRAVQRAGGLPVQLVHEAALL